MIVICPHCKDPIIIKKINCGIFRHGVLKRTQKQMNPHTDESVCEQLIKDDLIYGCGKPFKIVVKDGLLEAVECGYI